MDESKMVQSLGKFPLPVEIMKFGYIQTISKMEELGMHPKLRLKEGIPYLTDNGNYIVDLHLGAGFSINEVENALNQIVGVVENGLFLNTCNLIVVGFDDKAKIIYNHNK
jgi:ribose 5-phosphate isomerase A